MTKSVLLVMPDMHRRWRISEYLREAGYVVVSTSSYAGAVEELQANKPQFVVSDLFVPGVEGVEFAHRIRAHVDGGVRLRFVALLGDVFESDGTSANALGYDAFVHDTEAQKLPSVLQELSELPDPDEDMQPA